MAAMDESYQLLAVQFIRRQVSRLARELDGCRQAKDAEFVHQARVASRRLRSGMRMFAECVPAKKAKRWRKEIRRLTKSLGPARDADVQIEFVREFLAGVTERKCRAGIRRLLVRLRQHRARLQPRIVKAVDRMEKSGVLKAMRASTKATQSLLEGREVTIQSPFVFLQAERLILRKLEDVLAVQDCLANPADAARHHEMRIATKRLRYTMEICRPIYEGRLDDLIDIAKRIQTYLGDIHDCDVWMESLPAFMEEERARTQEYYGSARPFQRLALGLEYLRENRRQQREATFVELAEYWKHLADEGVWNRLAGTVVAAVQRSGQPEVAGQEPPPDAQAPAEAPAESEAIPARDGIAAREPEKGGTSPPAGDEEAGPSGQAGEGAPASSEQTAG